jgi:hypothetical protein
VREQVRRAVEQLKAELGAGAVLAEPDVPDDEVASIEPAEPSVAPAAMAQGEEAEVEKATPPLDEDDVREKVRMAVMESRAELEGPDSAETPSAMPRPEMRIPHYEALLDKSFLSPACMIIEDREGRVELVRVYRTLARLERAATANLANYSSHSVTVQMEERDLPPTEDIEDAISYAFERGCQVEIDGNRAVVRLSGSDTRAA